MSCYIELEMNCTTFTELIDYLTELLPHMDEPYVIMDLVRLIDFLEDEKERNSIQKNKEYQRDLEIQELFKKHYKNRSIVTDDFMYYKIQKILQQYDIQLNTEREFHVIMNIIDVFKKDE